MKLKFNLILIAILFLITKVDAQSWEKSIDFDDSHGNGISLLESTDDKIIAIGNRSNGFGSDLQETVFFHFNKEGDVLLQDTFQNSKCEKIITTSDNTILFLHTIEGVLNVTNMDYNSNIIWENQFPNVLGPPTDVIELPNNEGFLITGGVYDQPSDCNAFILKINSDGVLDWFTNIPGDEYEVGRKVSFFNNQYIVGGFKRINSSNEFSVAIWKINMDGVFQNEVIINNTDDFIFYSMVFDDLGNIYCTGGTSTSDSSKVFVLKSDLEGNTDWVNIYDSDDNSMNPSNEFGNDIILNEDNELIILSSLFNRKKLILYKVSTDGTFVESKIFGEINETQKKEGHQLIQEFNSNYYFVIGEQFEGDFFIAKVKFGVEVNTVQLSVDDEIKIIPNPAIEFIELEGLKTLSQTKIFDISGKQIQVSHTIENRININNLNSGIYFLTFYHNNQFKVLKFVKN